jgi:hypothetical protein
MKTLATVTADLQTARIDKDIRRNIAMGLKYGSD